MNLLKFLVVLALAFGGYNYWRDHRHPQQDRSASDTATSPGGFVSLPPVQGQDQSGILVVAAENCPHEDAQRADRLAEDLARKGLPVRRTHEIGFTLSDDNSATLERINSVMNGKLPIVFVRGRAKANPALNEVLAEFNSQNQ